jgi:hypothetical protein
MFTDGCEADLISRSRSPGAARMCWPWEDSFVHAVQIDAAILAKLRHTSSSPGKQKKARTNKQENFVTGTYKLLISTRTAFLPIHETKPL